MNVYIKVSDMAERIVLAGARGPPPPENVLVIFEQNGAILGNN